MMFDSDHAENQLMLSIDFPMKSTCYYQFVTNNNDVEFVSMDQQLM
jgi:hypothetical protein